MMLVTMQQIRDHIRSDTGDDDADVELTAQAASAAVIQYLGAYADSFLDTSGNVITNVAGEPVGVPPLVQKATLITIAWMVRERDGSQEYRVDAGYGYPLPQGATALLYPLRLPTIA